MQVTKKHEKQRLSGQRVPDVTQLVADGLEASTVGDDGEITLAFVVELVGEVEGAGHLIALEDVLAWHTERVTIYRREKRAA
jgi:hypothetical protein